LPMTEHAKAPKRIFLLGATGTIGRATVKALVARGHDLICFVRPGTQNFECGDLRFGDVTDPQSVVNEGFCGEYFDVVMSCMASRSGLPADAWAIDHMAHVSALAAAQSVAVSQFVLLSAICMQKPRLAFQHAKLAFEKALVESGLTYSIVRPTAYFKSLSGQVERVRKGKPFLVFGDGELTACKPISDADLASYLADCVDREDLHNRILPIGGPGEAMTPKQQGEMLFGLLGQQPHFKHVPLGLLDAIIGALDLAGRIVPAAARKAELARIGRYYATESMLVLDPETGSYDAAATPATGTQTLAEYYRALIAGEAVAERGEHSVF
jgi:divinyl chlorophyllide a 8-vinyl-reductase